MLSRSSRIWLFATLWTVASQAPLSMGFSRQEYWNGLPCPPPRDLPNPEIEPVSLTLPALAGRFCCCFFLQLVPSGKLPCPLVLSQKLGVRLEKRHHKVLPMSTYFAFSPLIHFPPTLHNYHLHKVPGSSVKSLLLRRAVRFKSQKELVGGSNMWGRAHLLLFGDWSENSTALTINHSLGQGRWQYL